LETTETGRSLEDLMTNTYYLLYRVEILIEILSKLKRVTTKPAT